MSHGKLAPLMSSTTHTWQTPASVLDLVRAVGPIELDPATDPSNPTGAARFYTEADDGLALPWGAGLVYVNPPYGRALRDWARKMHAEASAGAEIIALTPARTDTRWWQCDMVSASAICFWRGRITFVGAPAPAPFPSAISYWGRNAGRFEEVFATRGWIVRP